MSQGGGRGARVWSLWWEELMAGELSSGAYYHDALL